MSDDLADKIIEFLASDDVGGYFKRTEYNYWRGDPGLGADNQYHSDTVVFDGHFRVDDLRALIAEHTEGIRPSA